MSTSKDYCHKKLTFSGSSKDNFDNKLWCRAWSTSPCLNFGCLHL